MPVVAAIALSRFVLETHLLGSEADRAYPEVRALAEHISALRVDHVRYISVLDAGLRSPLADRADTLALQFDDFDPDVEPWIRHLDLSRRGPTEGAATEIADFVRAAHRLPGRVLLLAHCHAGVSRSGAIVTFAAEHCGISQRDLLYANPFIVPNKTLLRMLRSEGL